MFKKFLLTSLSALALTSTAMAADLPMRSKAPTFTAVPVFTWSGIYAGVHAGYSFDADTNTSTAGVQAANITNVSTNRRPGNTSLENEGFVGGGQIGANYQIGMFVLGAEADISYTDIDERTSFLSTVGDRSDFRQELNYLGTVRARVGVAFDRLLVYGTGGVAYGDVRYDANFFSNGAGAPLQFAGRRSDTMVGYAVGGGLEYALPTSFSLLGSSAVTFKTEYLYYDLGDKNVPVNAIAGVGTGGYVSNFETKGHIVRAGLNFKFAGF